MAGNTTPQLPIGYWLKLTDKVITDRANQVLIDQGFSRFRWQVLNMLYESGPITWQSIFNVMKTFIEARQLDEILDSFAQEGWLLKHNEGDSATFTLTEAGKGKREDIFTLQSEVRKQALQGISDQEYITVIDVLQRMVNNLSNKC